MILRLKFHPILRMIQLCDVYLFPCSQCRSELLWAWWLLQHKDEDSSEVHFKFQAAHYVAFLKFWRGHINFINV